MKSIAESDWKILREIKTVALDRYCQKVLDEIARLAASDDGSVHKRYLELWNLLRGRDKDLGLAFDDLRRSNAWLRLAAMRRLDMLTEEEFQRFGPETRAAVELYLS